MFTMFPRLREMKCLAASRAISMAPGDVGGEGALEAREVEIHQFLEEAQAGVIDQNVEIAEFVQNLANGALDVGFLGHVGMDWDARPSSCAASSELASYRAR